MSTTVLQQILDADDCQWLVIRFGAKGKCDSIESWRRVPLFPEINQRVSLYTNDVRALERLTPAACFAAEALPNRNREFERAIIWPETIKDLETDHA